MAPHQFIQLTPSDQSNTLSPSIIFNISVNNCAVILPFSEQQQKVGIFVPMNSHSGPNGCIFPFPMFCQMLSSSPTQGEKGSSPRTHAGSNSLVAKIIVHITGSLDTAVKPRMVNCVSLHADFICGLNSFGTKNCSLPTIAILLSRYCSQLHQ